MPKAAPKFCNWTAGELSPRVHGRVDIEAYFRGAVTLENMIVEQYGGAFRRQGTKYVAEVNDSSKKTRLIPFVFNTSQTYILEFGDYYMRVYKDEGQLSASSPSAWVTATEYVVGDFVTESGTTYICREDHTSGTFATDLAASKWLAQSIYEIITVYSADDLFDIQYAQTGDIMYFTHEDYPPQKLSRTGDISWAIDEVSFLRPAFLPTNATTTTLTPSADTGAGITITASTAIFDANDNGKYFRIGDGYVLITAYTDTTHVTATVQDEPDGSTGDLNTGPAATVDWAEGAWNSENGYPRAVAFYEQRSIWAGSTLKPVSIWGSAVGELENLKTGTNDDDGYLYTAAIAQNPIQWLSDGRAMIIGTEGATFSISSGSNYDALTPSNVTVKKESTYGANSVRPFRIGSYLYYMQRDDIHMRELGFNFDIDSYEALDMNLLSEHVNSSGITEMSYAQIPDSVAYCVRTDGVLTCCTRQIDQKVVAWTRQKLGGSFSTGDAVVESVAVIPYTDSATSIKYDQVWLIVKRTINSTTKRYIEFFTVKDFDSIEDAFYVDCGLTYDSSSTSTITGLDHLEGESVEILADGAVQTNKTVSSGEITLDTAASKVHVGIGFDSTLKCVRPEAGSATGTAQGKLKRTNKVGIRFYRTVGCVISDGDSYSERIPFRTPSMEMNEPVDLFTGDKIVDFGAGWTRDGYIQITQTQPLPMTILGIYPRMSTSD